MKNYLVAIFTLMALPFLSNAQKWEVGIFGGASHYNGEMSEGIIMLNHTHGAIGGLLKYNFDEKWTLRGGLYYGTISGNDADASDLIRRDRNLEFTSQITEFSLVPEFNLTGYKISSRDMTISPFIFAGIGLFKFNPYATNSTTGQQIPLQPLNTEGQTAQLWQEQGNPRNRYALTQLNVPIGVGLKFRVSRRLTMTVEISARKVFTDYLDDVSKTYISEDVGVQVGGDLTMEYSDKKLGLVNYGTQDPNTIPRGNPTTNDWYYFHGLGLTYTFFPPTCFKF